jgi:protease-4
MVKSSNPLVLACHPSWAGELARISSDSKEHQAITELAQKEYMGSAYPILAAGFDPNDVYQISENEYFSFGDGLRYHMTADNKRIALIPMKGALYTFSSYSSYEAIASKIKAAEHPAYTGALILADSPGGDVRKMDKLNRAISNYPKKIGVWVSGNLNSAAAYVTAGADFIMADPMEKNSLGSIGVFAIMENEYEKNEKEGVKVAIIRSEGANQKAKPNPFEPWEDEDMAKVQESVNESGREFLAVMSSQRGMDEEKINKVKTGAEFKTDEAIDMGLIDGKGTYEEAINQVATKQLFI